MPTLTEELRAWTGQTKKRVGSLPLEPRLEQVGRVVEAGDGVVAVTGLGEARLDELLVFENGVRGIAVDLGERTIGCVLLGDAVGIPAGSIVRGTGEVARVPVGDALLGRVVDGLGIPLDGKGPIATDVLLPIEQPDPQ